ncbi:MAG: radical SAM protein [Fusobacteriaceae bacterium]|uniref:radical SAM protein n=1 Tax=Romboutsia sp. TaxID=1965302 RepID=UPI003F2D01E8
MSIIIDKFYEKLKNKNYISIPYIEIVVATKCTLRCKDCANLMQYYDNPYIIDINTIKTSINRLIESVDNIEKFRILGGEPFLHPDLDEIINLVASSEKIKEVQIPTNGTILPKKESLIKALKHNKVSISISDYGEYSTKKKEIVQLGEQHNIKVEVMNMDYWLDYSSIECRSRSKEQLQDQYKQCNHQCTSLLNGKIFDCPRSAHGMDLGIIPKNSLEYIDLVDESKSILRIRREIIAMYNEQKKCIQACNYCNVGTSPKKIEPAIQLDTNDKKKNKVLIS